MIIRCRLDNVRQVIVVLRNASCLGDKKANFGYSLKLALDSQAHFRYYKQHTGSNIRSPSESLAVVFISFTIDKNSLSYLHFCLRILK